MDDNKPKPTENQPTNIFSMTNSPSDTPKPIFETVTVNQDEAPPEPQSATPLQPEEVSADVGSPEEALKSSEPEMLSQPPMPPHQDNKMKYLIVAGGVVFFILIFALLLKVIFGAKPVQKDVTLQYWGLWEDKQIYDPLIAQYQQKNPHVKINYQKMTPQDYREKLIARSKNGQGPDIFRFHNTWLPEIQEVASPLPSNIMSNSEFEKTFYPIHKKDLFFDNKYYYGLPLEVDGLVLVYNESLFKKAGINKAPATWDEILETLGKLAVPDQATGQMITSPIAIGTASNVEHFSEIFGLMLIQNGGSLSKLDQPEAADALESYRKFAEPPNEFWNSLMPNSLTAFIQEKVAMIIVPSWQILAIKGANPDLAIKVIEAPQLPGSKKPLSLASYWVEGVSKYSKNQIEAWKFLKYLSEKENMTKIYEQQSKTRLFGEPYSRKDLASSLIQNQYIGAVIRQAETDAYISLPLVSRTYDNGLNKGVVDYIENAINETVQGSSYSEALRKASQGVNQVFTLYKIE